jgi:hypothetical protein
VRLAFLNRFSAEKNAIKAAKTKSCRTRFTKEIEGIEKGSKSMFPKT